MRRGLALPIGSMMVGTRRFSRRARDIRKVLGGGRRQAGVIAAAGIISLEVMTKRVRDDHRHAAVLAEGLRRISGLVLDENSPQTNMIYFTIASNVPFGELGLVEKLAGRGIQIDWSGPRRIRLVTHYLVDDKAVEKTVSAFRDVFDSGA